MSANKWVITSLLTVMGAVTQSCGNDSKEKNTEAAREEGKILVTGQLALSQGLTQAASRAILLWEFLGGNVSGYPQLIELAEDGTFAVNVSNANESLEKIRASINSDGSINRDLLKSALPQYESDIDQASDEELSVAVEEMISEAESLGGATYLLVSYEPSDDRVSEAKSFQFVGLPTGGNGANLLGIPSDAIIADLTLGTISGEGDEVVAELAADSDIFDMSGATIQEFAAISNTLKVIKNYWMNAASDGKMPAEITPWFGWQISSLEDSLNQFSTPEALEYSGSGFYIGVNDINAAFNEVCPDAAANDAAASRKILNFIPPAAVVSGDTTVDSNNPFDNLGTLTQADQYSGRACYGESGVYIRNDEKENPANRSFQLGWGNIQGPLPEGIWQLKVDTETKGNYDLAAAYPIGSDGHPLVYVPGFKMTTDSDGKMLKFEARFYFYDRASSEYKQVTDMAAISRMVSETGIDIDFRNGETRPSVHIPANRAEGDRSATFADGIFTYEFIDEDQVLYLCTEDTSVQCFSHLGMSYKIGPVSYRMELRPDMSGGNE